MIKSHGQTARPNWSVLGGTEGLVRQPALSGGDEDFLDVPFVELHEEQGGVVLQVGEDGRPHAVRWRLDLGDDVRPERQLDHAPLLPLHPLRPLLLLLPPQLPLLLLRALVQTGLLPFEAAVGVAARVRGGDRLLLVGGGVGTGGAGRTGGVGCGVDGRQDTVHVLARTVDALHEAFAFVGQRVVAGHRAFRKAAHQFVISVF